LTLAEPLFLLISGAIVGSYLSSLIVLYLTQLGRSELMNRGILYALDPVPTYLIVEVCFCVCIFFIGVIMVLENIWRKKTIMR
jgi:hypothetical protein